MNVDPVCARQMPQGHGAAHCYDLDNGLIIFSDNKDCCLRSFLSVREVLAWIEAFGIRIEFQGIWLSRRFRKLDGLVGKQSNDVLPERDGLESLATYALLGSNNSASSGRVRNASLFLA